MESFQQAISQFEKIPVYSAGSHSLSVTEVYAMPRREWSWAGPVYLVNFFAVGWDQFHTWNFSARDQLKKVTLYVENSLNKN